MFTPGEVIRYENYEFVNLITGFLEGSRTKRFIILSATPFLVLKTTSQEKHYHNAKPGCQQRYKTYVIEPRKEDCFPQTTYVQLPQIIELPQNQIDVRVTDGRIASIGYLSKDCFKAVNLCLKQFKRDIPQLHWQLLFSRK